MVSNALDRSKKIPKFDSFLSIDEDILLFKSIKANAVEFLLRSPNCFEILCTLKFQSVG